MTADHAMWPQTPSHAHTGQRFESLGAVAAADLVPNMDALWVFGAHWLLEVFFFFLNFGLEF